MKTDEGMQTRICRKSTAKHLAIVLVWLMLLVCAIAQAQEGWPQIALSKDGTPISYEVYGTGEPTLVLVHGWSCDARYWREQIPVLSKQHRVVVLDLAGHGHSGMTRQIYTMKAFGEDVQAVAEATDSQHLILIGHSMGGQVIAEAARLMPTRVIALIGIDTLENIEYPLTQKALDQSLAPLKNDFRAGSRQFVSEMFVPQTDARLREWILSDMSAESPAVAISAMQEMFQQFVTGEAASIFEQIRIPVITVNASLWPINYAGNRRHMYSYDAIVVKDADHFMMLDRPKEFNAALQQAVQLAIEKGAMKTDSSKQAQGSN